MEEPYLSEWRLFEATWDFLLNDYLMTGFLYRSFDVAAGAYWGDVLVERLRKVTIG
jgi:hypothetical protein